MQQILFPSKCHAYFFVPDTERGISGLQRQLETRDRELDEERNKRKVLEKHFEKKTKQRIMNDVAKHRRTQNIHQVHHQHQGAFF